MENEQKIPQIIHYFWFGHGKQKGKNIKYIKKWGKVCSGFKIMRWDETNFDVNVIPFTKEAYERGQWAFVSDYARLKVLYEYGGIQFDSDVELIKNFSKLLKYEGFIGFESDDRVNDGQGFGVMPHHPIVKEMLDMYENLSFVNKDGSFNKILSPVARTEVLVKHGLKLDGSRQNIEGIEVFPAEYFCPKDFVTRKITITKNTYSIHHFASSWHSKTEKRIFTERAFFCRLLGREKGLKVYNKCRNAEKWVKRKLKR